ncbi:hypothetical protein DFJ73DRAFT_963673 [Zopfochytrium polystomum]|nr:hypothetical protein DFJ73DRAFT_963673 [Zopfochytrium polystomum]
MGRLEMYGALSVGLASVVIANAFYLRGHFYTACLHLTRSSSSMLVLLNLGLYLTIVFARFFQRLFFGELRALEVEVVAVSSPAFGSILITMQHLYERSWFAITETCLAMTIFRDEFDMRFIVLFGLLLVIKIFHWISAVRVDFMEQAPNTPPLFHVRMISVMVILVLVDLGLLAYSVDYTFKKGASMMIIFGFEYMILVTLMVSTIIKYIIHSIDLVSEHPWENKSMYLFYVDLVVDFFKLVTYMFFFGIIVNYYGFPLHILRDLYITLRSFVQRCRDLVQYRRATANMNERYPDATAADLQATDRVCIICREEMELPAAAGGAAPAPGAAPAAQGAAPARPPAAGSRSNVPKKLQCGHIFHFQCLRSWLERQQSCPTCRRSVLDAAPGPLQPGAPAGPAAGPQPGQQPPPLGGANAAAPAAPRPDAAAPAPRMLHQMLPSLAGGAEGPNVSLSNLATPLEELSDDQLRTMEGTSREAIIQRLRAIQNIQNQLAGVATQFTQVLQMMPDEVGVGAAAPLSSSSSSSSSAVSKGKQPTQ